MKNIETKTLALALDVLALNMPDGVSCNTISQAANRLHELAAENERLKKAIRETLEENRLFGDFVFKNECRDYCRAYVVALRILGETAKSQWTPDDVIDAVLRAAKSPNESSSPTGGVK